MGRRTLVILIVVTSLLLTFCYPTVFSSSQTREFYILYFRENMLPYLSRSPPTEREGNLTLAKEFRISNITAVEDTIYLDLYFKAPLFNLTGLINLFVIVVSAFSNMSMEMSADNKSIIDFMKELIENASKPSWNFTLHRENLVLPQIGYNITISIGNVTVHKVITVELMEEDDGFKTAHSMEDIFENLTSYIQMLTKMKNRVVHKTFKIDGIKVDGKDKKDMVVSVQCTDETLRAIAPFIELFKLANESELKALVELYLGFANLTKFSIFSGAFVNILIMVINWISGSVGFIYNSADYPSNLKFYGFISGSERFGMERYYLKGVKTASGHSLILDESEELSNETIEKEISSNALTWVSEPFAEPVRILGNFSLHLYIKCKNPAGIYPVEISLLDKLGYYSTEIETTTTKIYGFKYIKPSIFDVTIENVDHTFEKGHSLSVRLTLTNRSVAGIEFTLYRPTILFNSTEYPSCVEFTTAPLDDIKLAFSNDTELNQEIRRVDVKHYNVTITNRGETGDNITLSLILYDEDYYQWPSGWRVVIKLPNGTEEEVYSDWDGEMYLSGEDSKKISVDIYPSPDSKDGMEITFIFSASGEYRGSDVIHDTIKLSVGEIGIVFVEEPENREVALGKTCTYTFRVKNTGNDVDDFLVNATSEHNWLLSDGEFVIDNLYPGNESEFNITVRIPDSLPHLPLDDDLKVVVTSLSDPSKMDTAWVITTAVEPTIIERISTFFGSVYGGLEEKFGGNAIYIVVGIIVLIISIFAVLLYILRKKDILVICTERIKELTPNEEGRFDILVKNITKKKVFYKIDTKKSYIPEGWEIEVQEEQIELNPGEERMLSINVKATPRINPDEWAEINLRFIPEKGRKSYKMTLLALPKDAKIDLKMENVTHSPKTFKSGDTVTTKFNIVNSGNVSAKNIKISLHLNGIKMNEVDIPEIPPGGCAKVEIPWLAYPGKNDIHITAEM